MIRLAALALLLAPSLARADPITITVALAPYIGGTLAAFVASNALALGFIAVQVTGAVIGRRKARSAAARARADALAALQDRSVTILQSTPPWPVVYGRSIVGGTIVAILTTDKTGYRENGTSYSRPDTYKHIVIVLAAHEVAAINEVFIEGVPLGTLDGSGWVTAGEFSHASAWPDTRTIEIGAGSAETVPEAVVAITAAYYTTGVGVDLIHVPVTPTLSGGNTIITNPDGANSITVTYTIAADPSHTASVRVSKHLGSTVQAVDSYLNGVAPTEWTSNHRLRGLAYVVVTLDLDEPRFQGGPPQMTFDVSGKLVYDPRTSSTAWSANPALLVRDFLTSAWGYECTSGDIDDAMCNAAANACEVRQLAAVHAHADTCTASASTDELTFATERWFGIGDGVRFTTSGTLPSPLAAATTYYAIPGSTRRVFKFATTRANAIAGTAINITSAGTGTHTGTWYDYDTYTAHGAFSSGDSREAVLEDLCESMAGFAAYGAKWQIAAGAWTASVMTLSDDDLDGQIGIAQAGVGIDQLFNGIRGTYIPAGKASPTDFNPPYQNTTFVTADGRELWTDISLPYTENPARCRNLARIFTERNRDGQVITYPAKLKAWPLQIGDRVTVNSTEYGFSSKTYRVTDWQFGASTAVQLTLQEDIAATYDLADAATADPSPNTGLPNPWSVAALSGLAASSGSTHLVQGSDGTLVPRVWVSWDAVTDAYVTGPGGQIVVLWMRPGSTDWTRVTTTGDATGVYLHGNIRGGDPLTIEAYAVNQVGARGPAEFIAHTVEISTELLVVRSGEFYDTFNTGFANWVDYTGDGELSIVSITDSTAGGKALQIGNNSGNDQAWLIHAVNIPFDPAALYRMRVRLARTAGSGDIYLGVAGVADDGATLVNKSGTATHSNQHYIVKNAFDPADTSQHEYVGYFQGTDTTGTGTACPDPTAPGVLHEDVRYIRPLVLVNYSSAAGTVKVDYVAIEKLKVTDDIAPEAATEILQDTYDFGGATYGTTTARTVSFTPAADCTIELTATLVAEEVLPDAAHTAIWYVSAGGGADTAIAGCPSVSTAKQAFTMAESFAADGGVALDFKLKTSRPAFDPDIVLYESALRITAIKR